MAPVTTQRDSACPASSSRKPTDRRSEQRLPAGVHARSTVQGDWRIRPHHSREVTSESHATQHPAYDVKSPAAVWWKGLFHYCPLTGADHIISSRLPACYVRSIGR